MRAIWKYIAGHLQADDASGRLIFCWEATESQGTGLALVLNSEPALSNLFLAPWITGDNQDAGTTPKV